MKKMLLVLIFIISLFFTGKAMSQNTQNSDRSPANGRVFSDISRFNTTVALPGNVKHYSFFYCNRNHAVFLAATKSSYVIYHEPVFMLNEANNPKFVDMPYIWDVQEENGKIIVTFNFSLSSPELIHAIRDHLLKAEQLNNLIKFWGENVSFKSITELISVERELVNEITVFFLLDNRPLGVGIKDKMGGYTDNDCHRTSYPLDVKFTPENWEIFKKNKEKIEILPLYAVFRESTSSVQSNTSAQIEVTKIIKEQLGAKREGFFYADEYKMVQSKISSSLYSSISANDPDLIACLQRNLDNIYSRLINERELSFEDLKGHPEYTARFAEHFKPLIDRARSLCGTATTEQQGQTQEKGRTVTDTQEHSETNKISGGVKVGNGVVGASAEASNQTTDTEIHSTQDHSNEINQEFNGKEVHYSYLEDKQKHVLDKLKVYEVREGYEKLATEEVQSIELKKKLEGCTYISSSPLPLRVFNSEEVFKDVIVPPTSSSYEPIGTVRLFIGETIPPGWVEWKEGGTFPKHSEIPEELRGKPFPSLNGVLLGVGTEEQRGLVEKATVKELEPLKRTRLPYYKAAAGVQQEFIYDPKYEVDPNKYKPDYLKVRLIIKFHD